MKKKQYFIMFNCGYGCLVWAEFLPDAIVLAKAAAIEKGYTLPILEYIRFPHGKTVLCGHPFDYKKEIVPDYSGDF